jgi:DNA processing protein
MLEGAQKIRFGDQKYPPQLKHTHQPPQQLYVRGNIELLAADNLLAVVGSRKASAYGSAALKKILTPAVRAGIVVVSGLAYGIDAMAHRLSLAESQATVAVLGSGLDDNSLYPRAHTALARQISIAGGAVISEYPPGTPGRPGQFPARNRIIAALCRATLVVQANERSGSLITARLALEGGKDVLAVPGSITDPLSAGTNSLIQQGATPVLAAQDILDIFGLTALSGQAAALPKLSAAQRLVVGTLSAQPRHIDEVARQTKLMAAEVSVALTELEMIEAVRNVGGMNYIKT